MNKEKDLRWIRTEEMIKSAFLELLGKYGFQKITIDFLAKKSYISRKTFYLHYRDKEDLLDHIENEIAEGIRDIIISIPAMVHEEGFKVGSGPTLQHLKQYQYIKENEHVIKILFAEKSNSSLLSKIENVIYEVFSTGYTTKTWNIPEKYVFSSFAKLNGGIIKSWIESGMQESPEELAKMTTVMGQWFVDLCSK